MAGERAASPASLAFRLASWTCARFPSHFHFSAMIIISRCWARFIYAIINRLQLQLLITRVTRRSHAKPANASPAGKDIAGMRIARRRVESIAPADDSVGRHGFDERTPRSFSATTPPPIISFQAPKDDAEIHFSARRQPRLRADFLHIITGLSNTRAAIFSCTRF